MGVWKGSNPCCCCCCQCCCCSRYCCAAAARPSGVRRSGPTPAGDAPAFTASRLLWDRGGLAAAAAAVGWRLVEVRALTSVVSTIQKIYRVSLRLSAQQGQPAQRGEQRVSHQRRRIRRRRRRAGGSGGGGGEGDRAGSHPCPGGRGDAAGAWRAGPYHAGKSRDSDEVEAEVESRAPIGVSSTHLTLRFVRFPLLESHFRSERSENLSKSVCSAECNKSER